MRNISDRRTLIIHLLVQTCLLCLLTASAQAQSGNGQQLTQSVVAGGGGSSSDGATQVDGTAGQSVTGTSTGGSYTLESGFWSGAAALTPSSLVASDATGTYGGTVTLTATLTANGANLSGKDITFSLNGTSVGTANTDSNGVATLNNVSLAGITAGVYPAATGAQFAGDATFDTISATSQLTVQKATPLLQVAGGTFTYDGQPHPATAMATGINNEVLTPISVLYNGGSSVPVNAGTHTVTASFAGNTNYNAVSNSTQSIIINQATQTITFGALSGKTYGDADFSVSATSSSGLAVTFSATGQCNITGATVHITGAGLCQITASLTGNTNYSAATPVSQSFNINKATATVALSNLQQTFDGTAKSASATTTPSSLTFSFTYSQNGSAVASPTNAGSYDVTATVSDANYQGSATDTLVINKASSTTTASVSNATYDGQPHGGTASVTGAGGLSQSLTINYTGRNGTVYSSTTSPTNAGDYTASASFAGDANHTASSDSRDFQIAKAAQTITFGALVNRTYGDTDFSTGATSSSGLSLSFTASGQCTVNASGSNIHLTGAGSCTITAAQAGNQNYNAAANVSQSFSIAQAATTTTVTSSANPSPFGQNVTFTATVTSTAGGTPSGTVQFKDNGTNIGNSVALNASSVASFQTSGLTSGAHTITADYSGDTNFTVSTGTLSGGQSVGTQLTLSINDVTLAEGDSGTTSFVFTITLSANSTQMVTVNYQTVDATAAIADNDYQAASGTLTLNPGETQKTITVSVNGDATNEPDETFLVTLSNAANATLAKAQGTGTILNDDAPGIQLSASAYTVGEGDRRAILTVTRSGDLSQPASVNYATSDQSGLTPCNVVNGFASQRCDYGLTIGLLRFAAGESTKTITIPIIDDAYTEGPETFTLTLSNPQDATLGVNSSATITIADNDGANGTNPIDGAAFFVRQHYLDFLNREPEPAGFQGWLTILNNCPSSGVAADGNHCDRIEVSSDFYRSEEFQTRGYFIYRFYAASLGRIPHYSEFMPEMARVSGFLTTMDLETMKTAFVRDFMNRTEFKNRYDVTQNDAAGYVKLLEQTAGVTLSAEQTLIAGLQNGSETRATVLRKVVESLEVISKFYNEAFVVEAYFGYLRRDPDALYLQWLQTVNQSGGYQTLINGFVNSLEYRQRFGQ